MPTTKPTGPRKPEEEVAKKELEQEPRPDGELSDEELGKVAGGRGRGLKDNVSR